MHLIKTYRNTQVHRSHSTPTQNLHKAQQAANYSDLEIMYKGEEAGYPHANHPVSPKLARENTASFLEHLVTQLSEKKISHPIT